MEQHHRRAFARRGVAALGALALSASLPAAAFAQAPQSSVIRLEAADNVEAAVAFSEATFESASTVLVGREDLFPDLLASGSLQGLGAPLLLTDTDELSVEVADEIERLGATEALILGGEVAVSADVQAELEGLGLTVDRRQGESRFETAIAIAENDFADADTAIVARAFGQSNETQAFADSLAGGGLAADLEIPILLSQTDELAQSTADYLAASSITTVYLLGGVQALSQAVEDELAALDIDVQRLQGAERRETAVAIAEERGFADAADAERIILVDGFIDDAFAPGFAAAAHAKAFDAPILLVGNDFDADDATGQFLVENVDATLVCAPYVAEGVCDAAVEALGLTDTPPVTGVGDPVVTVQNIDGVPELVEATFVDNGETVDVDFVFDSEINGPGGAVLDRFLLYTADALSFTPVGVEIVPGENTVRAEFIGNLFDLATTAAVDAGAVSNTEGVENPEGSTPLKTGAFAPGETLGPDLVSVGSFVASSNSVEFVFDEDANVVGPPANYFLIDDTGATLVGTAVVDGDGTREHRVTFGPGFNQTEFNSIVRAGVFGSTVEDGLGIPNSTQTVDVNDMGLTDNPNLVSVNFDQADDNIAIFTFDEPVSLTGMPADFFVYDNIGTVFFGVAAARSSTDPNSVDVTFDDGAIQARTVGGVVVEGAVTATSGVGGRVNQLDEEGQSLTFAAGATEGPLLVGARVTGVSPQIRIIYTFNQQVSLTPPDSDGDGAVTPADDLAVDRNADGVINADDAAAGFRAYGDDGDQHVGTAVQPNLDNQSEVFVTFTGATQTEVQQAVLAGVDGNTVFGVAGTSEDKGNVEASVVVG